MGECEPEHCLGQCDRLGQGGRPGIYNDHGHQ